MELIVSISDGYGDDGDGDGYGYGSDGYGDDGDGDGDGDSVNFILCDVSNTLRSSIINALVRPSFL